MPKRTPSAARVPHSRLALLVGALALLLTPAVVIAQGGGSLIGLRTAHVAKLRTGTASSGGRQTTKISGQSDPDRDGLSTETEWRRTKTNPTRFDTDRDGYGDGAEMLAGSNPLDRRSTPKLTAPAPSESQPSSSPAPEPPSPADTASPETTIGSGPAATTTATDASFGFSSSESGSTFQCKLDSGSWAGCGSPKAYSSLALGSHTFSVKATDSAGNTDATPAAQSWSVQAPPPPPPTDTTPPETTIGSGPASTTTSTEASFGFSSSESGSTFQCKLDSGSWGSCSSPKAYSSLALGSHAFSVKATDGAGNTDATPATQSWSVQAPADTTPPQTTINSGPAASTTATDANFGFSASESGSTFQCKLDSGSWGGCSSPKSISGLALGSHTFAVKATDGAGNTDATPATQSWSVQAPESGGGSCTQTLAAGANLPNAIAAASAGAVICLHGGTYSGGRISAEATNKSNYVTVQSVPGETASVGWLLFDYARYLRLQNLKFTAGVELLPAASHVQLIGNEITGREGIYLFGDTRVNNGHVDSVLIQGNNIHNIDYSGSQGAADGYGIKGIGETDGVTISANTIKSVAADYIQSAGADNWTVDGNTFLGPTLVGAHPSEHQDLWQAFSGGTGLTFNNNVARDTGTAESLLFQEPPFQNVKVENNLLVNDSDGYSCQLYQSSGLIFRNNTIVNSHWGCLFRDESSKPDGSGYQVDHNVFTNTEANSGISTEGSASSWGTYDYNVSDDASASGSHSVRNWSPSWADTVDYSPQGLPFAAGYRKP